MLIPGDIVDAGGVHLGRHDGLANYTIGQRKGLTLGSPRPLYVIRKELSSNRLVVGDKADLGSLSLTADSVNWVGGAPPSYAFAAEVKTRYTAVERPATVTLLAEGSRVRVTFDQPQRDITPGQAAVFMQDDVVLGGGIIQSADSEPK
jgi:tRNA-specific 2-thiouridylase